MLPGSAFSTGPTITAPPIPATTEYSASTPTRISAREKFAGRAPALIPRIEATR